MRKLDLFTKIVWCCFLFLVTSCVSDAEHRSRVVPDTNAIPTDSNTEGISPSTAIVEEAPLATQLTFSPFRPTFRLIYVVTEGSRETASSEVWLFDSRTENKQVLITTSPGITINSINITWHPLDKNLIYYIQRETDGSWALWEFNLIEKQRTQITNLFSTESVGLIGDWSADGKRLNLFLVQFIEGIERQYTYIIDRESGGVLEIKQSFLFAWSPTMPNQYIFYDPVIEGQAQLVVKDVISSLPVQTINLEFPAINSISWHPSGKELLVVTGGLALGGFELFGYDFSKHEWRKIQELKNKTTNYAPTIDLSPSGEWLTLNYFSDLYVLREDQLETIHALLTEVDFPIVVEAWLSQPERVIVSSENKLWLLNPNLPGEKIELLDLGLLGLESPVKLDIQIQQ